MLIWLRQFVSLIDNVCGGDRNLCGWLCGHCRLWDFAHCWSSSKQNITDVYLMFITCTNVLTKALKLALKLLSHEVGFFFIV
jgi:hypothetical protein